MVEREAEFPAGEKVYGQYLQENMDPDVPVKKTAPVGTYKVGNIIVSKTGKVKGIAAETSHGYSTLHCAPATKDLSQLTL
jgi:hypothetical protein